MANSIQLIWFPACQRIGLGSAGVFIVWLTKNCRKMGGLVEAVAGLSSAQIVE